MCSHTWSNERTILAREGISVRVEIANERRSTDQDFQKVDGSLLIDTGAQRTGIRKDILETLRLKATGTVETSIVGGGKMRSPTYGASLRFPEFEPEVGPWKADCWLDIVGLDAGHSDFGLLGRDLLDAACLVYDGANGTVAH